MPYVIGFTGLAGAGKDTAARALRDALRTHGQPAILDSFAAPIRAISARVGLDPFDRPLKETRRAFTQDGFCGGLQFALDEVLGRDLPESDRAALYSYTIEALARFAFEGWGGQGFCLSPREFMQVLGTEGGQRVRQNLWVDLATARWRGYDGTVLVTDVRFAHELDVLDRLILVERPGLDPTRYHASERLAAFLTQGIWRMSSRFVRRLPNCASQARLQYRARKIASRHARGKSW